LQMFVDFFLEVDAEGAVGRMTSSVQTPVVGRDVAVG